MTIIVHLTQVIGGYRQPEKTFPATSLKDAKAAVKEKFPDGKHTFAIWQDRKDGPPIQTGFGLRVPGNGVYWITFSELVSAERREVRSIAIKGRTP